ncbi:hypothetical protein [Microbacterium protaetiae]|nr:hypothetical protein [Microbacterium protaetiae]
MTSAQPPAEPADGPQPRQRLRLGIDWWAVILAGVFVVLAATGLLPTIGW